MFLTAEQDYLQAYLQTAWSAPSLSRAREVELATQMKQGGRVAQRARDELVIAHLKLAASLAKKYTFGGKFSLDDLVQEANIGLLVAVDKFEVERGFRFSTCAYHWVRSQIQLYVSGAGGPDVRLSLNRQRDVRNLKGAIKALEDRGVAVTDAALARELDVSVKVVRDYTEALISHTSLSAPVGENGTEFGEFLPDEHAPNPEQVAIAAEQREIVRAAVADLPERDRAIITMRFDLDDEGERTLEDVSQVFGVTRERIRQLEVKAIERLRKVKKIRPAGSPEIVKTKRRRASRKAA
jgi:RNA polymerase primary sigma factor